VRQCRDATGQWAERFVVATLSATSPPPLIESFSISQTRH